MYVNFISDVRVLGSNPRKSYNKCTSICLLIVVRVPNHNNHFLIHVNPLIIVRLLNITIILTKEMLNLYI